SALEAAEQLRQAMQVEKRAGFVQSPQDAQYALLESVMGQALRDQGVVVRPDRAVVIRHRIVARLARGYGSHPPAGKRLGAKQHLRHARSPFTIDNAGEKALACVRRSDPARLLVAVQGQGVGANVVAPERRLEALL